MASEEITLKVVQSNVGGQSGSTGAVSSADAVTKGMSKSLSLTAISLNQTVDLLGKMLGVLSKSSQQLAGILKLFEKAFMIALRPLGDLIAQLLKPLLRLMLKGAIEQMRAAKEYQQTGQENIEAGAEKLLEGDIKTKLEGAAQLIIGGFQKVGSMIASIPILGPILIAFKNLFDLLFKALGTVGKWVWDKFLVPIGEFFTGVATAIWGFVKDAGIWIWDNLVKPLINFLVAVAGKIGELVGKIGTWVWENVAEPIIKFFKHIYAKMREIQLQVALWVKENIIDPVVNFFKKIWEKLTEIYNKVKDWVKEYITDPIVKFFKKIKSFLDKISPSGLYESGKSAVKSALGINDGVITPTGQVVKTDPKDYIIATKNPASLLGGGGAQTVNINISIQEINNEDHIRRLATEVSRAIQRNNSYRVGA